MLEALKSHPMVAPLIKEGKPKEYLAHWLAEGAMKPFQNFVGRVPHRGDSAMFFNALHREGSNLAMTSGRFAAHAILDALNKGDFSARGLESYVERLQKSYVLQDLKKYRRFPSFLEKHEELFSTLPAWQAWRPGKCSRSMVCPKRKSNTWSGRPFEARSLSGSCCGWHGMDGGASR
jgi:electron transfer flavoprotein-quinone oxidoreductase